MSEYTRIEYIQATGSQYIDTNVTPTQNTKVRTKLAMTAVTGNVIIGHQGSESSTVDTADWRLFNYNNKFYLDINSQRVYGSTFSNNTIYNIEFGNNYVTNLDTGASILSGTTESSFAHSVTIKIFRGPSGYASGKLYYLQIFEGDILVRDYVPVINSSNVVGLYDRVNKVFYAGSGTFTAGPVIETIPAISPYGFRKRALYFALLNNKSFEWTTLTGTWNQTTNNSAIDSKSFTCASPGNNGSTRIRCTFKGVKTIVFACSSSGESGCDYLTVGALDSTCNRSTYGTMVSNTSKDVTYTCNGKEHYVEFCYSKDYSLNSGSDNATVYIKSIS